MLYGRGLMHPLADSGTERGHGFGWDICDSKFVSDVGNTYMVRNGQNVY